MAKDYAKRKTKTVQSPRQKAKTRRSPPILWLLSGLIIGLIVTSVYYLTRHEPTAKETASVAKAHELTEKVIITADQTIQPDLLPKEKASVSVTIPEPIKPSAPKYEFYNMLPHEEVPIAKPDGAAKTTLAAPVSDTVYLQVASLSNYTQADSLRARLALQGLNPLMKTVTLDKTVHYRVYLGPFQNSNELSKVQNQLTNQNINPLIVHKI